MTDAVGTGSGGLDRLGMAALFAGAAAIAFAPIFVRLSETGPIATGFWRVALAAPILWLAALTLPRAQPDAAARSGPLWPWTLAAGLAFAGDLAAWHVSITWTTVANATLFANFTPILMTLAGWLMFGERITARFGLGALVSLVGAGLVVGATLDLAPERLPGDLLGLLTAVFYTGYMIAVKRLRATRGAVQVMAATATVTAAALLPLAWALEGRLLPTAASGWAALAGLALISHVVGQSLIALALGRLPASFSSVGLLLQPALAAALGWALLSEALGWRTALGGAAIVAGIALAATARRR